MLHGLLGESGPRGPARCALRQGRERRVLMMIWCAVRGSNDPTTTRLKTSVSLTGLWALGLYDLG